MGHWLIVGLEVGTEFDSGQREVGKCLKEGKGKEREEGARVGRKKGRERMGKGCFIRTHTIFSFTLFCIR